MGSNKTPMGYVETNWSLPRSYQEIIERQNIYDGTWRKTPSMGFMFVPLTQYHGGGAAATIEPLNEHLDHYETRLRNLFGAGVQACYRGPRLYDTEQTRKLGDPMGCFLQAVPPNIGFGHYPFEHVRTDRIGTASCMSTRNRSGKPSFPSIIRWTSR